MKCDMDGTPLHAGDWVFSILGVFKGKVGVICDLYTESHHMYRMYPMVRVRFANGVTHNKKCKNIRCFFDVGM